MFFVENLIILIKYNSCINKFKISWVSMVIWMAKMENKNRQLYTVKHGKLSILKIWTETGAFYGLRYFSMLVA